MKKEENNNLDENEKKGLCVDSLKI